jgi:lipid-A-disaccharide synthase
LIDEYFCGLYALFVLNPVRAYIVTLSVFISAGDASGDTHAAGLALALQQHCPGVRLTGVGDAALAATGTPLLADQHAMRQVGVGAVVRSAPYHWQLGQRVVQHIAQHKPDRVVLIDYGGFHLRLARAIRQQCPEWHGKLVYFIPPQIWASRAYRLQTLRQTAHLVLGILPFEQTLYQQHGLPYQFVGHPTTWALPPKPTDYVQACQQLGLDPTVPIVALLPGSRRSELKTLLPIIMQAIPLVQAAMGHPIQWCFAQAPGVNLAPWLQPWQQQFGPSLQLSTTAHTHTLQAIAQAAVVKSGTSTLEVAWYGTPQVIIYKGSWLTQQVFKYMATVPCLGLANLLSLPGWQPTVPALPTQRQLPPQGLPYPECLQTDLTPHQLAQQVLALLMPGSATVLRQQAATQQLHQLLTVPHSPYAMAAQAVVNL